MFDVFTALVVTCCYKGLSCDDTKWGRGRGDRGSQVRCVANQRPGCIPLGVRARESARSIRRRLEGNGVLIMLLSVNWCARGGNDCVSRLAPQDYLWLSSVHCRLLLWASRSSQCMIHDMSPPTLWHLGWHGIRAGLTPLLSVGCEGGRPGPRQRPEPGAMLLWVIITLRLSLPVWQVQTPDSDVGCPCKRDCVSIFFNTKIFYKCGL